MLLHRAFFVKLLLYLHPIHPVPSNSSCSVTSLTFICVQRVGSSSYLFPFWSFIASSASSLAWICLELVQGRGCSWLALSGWEPRKGAWQLPLTRLFLAPPSLLSHLHRASPSGRALDIAQKGPHAGAHTDQHVLRWECSQGLRSQPCQELHTQCHSPQKNIHEAGPALSRSQMKILKLHAM